jgi:uncharacterized protein (DUF58 family)
MKAGVAKSNPNPGWSGLSWGGRRGFRWNEFLWALIYPARNHRITPTVPGLVLIGLALGIGSAAYNTSSNILFITLSLLLACLILSGVMSWFNLRGVCWRLLLQPPSRAGQQTPVTLELWNRKTLLPTYGLWFELTARPAPVGPQRPEATFRASSAEIKAAFARSEQATTRAILPLCERLDPGGQTRLDWFFTPQRRGVVRVELAGVGSLFPFGFLRKNRGTRLRREVIVWPAPVEYRFMRTAAAAQPAEGERVARPGVSNDLLTLRRYQAGDSHRLIHWKASARLRQLMVRQFAAESAEGFFLWLTTPPGVWAREEQFELLCRLAATLAEDLFTAGRLTGTAVNREEPMVIRRVRDLESFLDRLAVLEFAPEVQTALQETGRLAPARRNVITFAPEGSRGVAAYVDGEKTATA